MTEVDAQIKQNKKKVVIVHDFLLYYGGAEKVLMELMKMYPDAPIYTLLYDEARMGKYMKDRDVRTSFLQNWPQWLRRRHKLLLCFYGPAIEAMDLRDFDVAVSSSGAWSKGLVTRLNTRHIAYVHSPMRYAWDENERYLKRAVVKSRFVVRHALSYLRLWDYQAAQRPDVLIANSHYTAERIKKYYHRDVCDVVYPPVAIPEIVAPKNDTTQEERSFVMISRLSAYKNVALAIEVCNKLQLPLEIIGEGPERKHLESISGGTITFHGWVDDDRKYSILQNGRALFFPCEDDFGIVSVEALACGVPVIALRRGGAGEIVKNGVHGTTFEQPTIEVMADGVRRFLEQEDIFDAEVLKERARTFSPETFRTKITQCVNQDNA